MGPRPRLGICPRDIEGENGVCAGGHVVEAGVGDGTLGVPSVEEIENVAHIGHRVLGQALDVHGPALELADGERFLPVPKEVLGALAVELEKRKNDAGLLLRVGAGMGKDVCHGTRDDSCVSHGLQAGQGVGLPRPRLAVGNNSPVPPLKDRRNDRRAHRRIHGSLVGRPVKHRIVGKRVHPCIPRSLYAQRPCCRLEHNASAPCCIRWSRVGGEERPDPDKHRHPVVRVWQCRSRHRDPSALHRGVWGVWEEGGGEYGRGVMESWRWRWSGEAEKRMEDGEEEEEGWGG